MLLWARMCGLCGLWDSVLLWARMCGPCGLWDSRNLQTATSAELQCVSCCDTPASDTLMHVFHIRADAGKGCPSHCGLHSECGVSSQLWFGLAFL